MTETIQLDRQMVTAPFLVADAVRAASERFRRPYPVLVREVATSMFGPGKVQPAEYFKLRMFDPGAMPRDELKRIAGRRVEYAGNMAANDIALWRDLTEDKLAIHAFFCGLGYPTPELLAFYHPRRSLGTRFPALATRDALAAFLRRPEVYPLFVKPNDLRWSLGAASLASVDGDQVVDIFGRRASASDLAEQIATMGEQGGFLLQRTARNHPALEAVCGPALATTRVLVARIDGEPRVLRAHIKLPTGRNVADNTWRAGNLAVGVDPATGALGRAWMGAGLDATEHSTHPDTGASLGITLPLWEEARALVLDASRALDGLRLIGWDVSLTPEGPVLIEANSDPDWAVNQRVTGRGMLDAEVTAFLDHCKKNPRTKK